MNIYVASSWRNECQPQVVEALRLVGHEVYDFKHPYGDNDSGFHWTEIDPKWKQWNSKQFIKGLNHPIAIHGFNKDMNALTKCDACVLIMPCGRSAHLELGWAIGNGKKGIILLEDSEPELMYSMVDCIATTIDEVVDYLQPYI